jgi:phage terminase large subunit-like protein
MGTTTTSACFPLNPAEQYIQDVIDGKLVVSEWVRKTCLRHQRDLETGHERGLVFDPQQAVRPVRFFRALRLVSDGISYSAGDPFTLLPWQQALCWILYGWRTTTGKRRFSTAYITLARGNGKSSLLSGLCLYALVGEGIQGAEVFSLATTRDQARIVFDESVLMAKRSQALASLHHSRNSIFIPDTASKFLPLSSDEDTLDGLRPSLLCADELHKWLGKSGRGVWNVSKTALGKKPGSLLIAITTAGYDRHSVCYEQHEYACKVLDGILEDDSFFSWIAALSEDDDPFDEANWPKANPSLGITLDPDTLRQAAKQAKEIPTEYSEFLRLRCNIWTTSHTSWMPLDAWDACNGSVEPDALKARPCFAGIDLSSQGDITALVLVFPPYGSDTKWSILPFFWVPGDNIRKRVEKDRVPYDQWQRLGLIEPTLGNVIDDEAIRLKIVELSKHYDIREVAFDPWHALSLSIRLMADGFTTVPIRQGVQSLNAPMRKLMDLVVSGQLAHGGNPVLRWNASNVVAEADAAGNIKPDKAESRERIDGISAAITALARAMVVNISKPKWFTPRVI